MCSAVRFVLVPLSLHRLSFPASGKKDPDAEYTARPGSRLFQPIQRQIQCEHIDVGLAENEQEAPMHVIHH